MDANLDTFPKEIQQQFESKFEEVKMLSQSLNSKNNTFEERLLFREEVKMKELNELRAHIQLTVQLALDFGTEISASLEKQHQNLPHKKGKLSGHL